MHIEQTVDNDIVLTYLRETLDQWCLKICRLGCISLI